MFSFIRDIQRLTVLEEVGERWIEEVKALGVVRASYHMTPAFASQTGPDVRVIYYGFSKEVIELYDNPKLRKLDPIPDAIMQLGRPRTWKRILADLKSEKNYNQLTAMAEKHGIADGFAIPLYGPNGRDSYSSFDIGRKIEAKDEPLLQKLMGIGQIAHVRICLLVREQFMRKIDLSAREREVLQWIASSKSIGDIATILNLSRATVDTYTRRLYSKLGAHSRIDAVTIALSHGLVRL